MSHLFSRNKRSTIIRFSMVVFLLFTMFAIPQPASACSCIMPGPLDIEFSQATAVFSGRVVNIKNNYTPIVAFAEKIATTLGFDPFYFYTDRFWGNTVTFEVTNSWKLVNTTTIQVRTGNGGGDCGYGFSVGSDYLVYAGHIRGEGLGTSICTRTTELSSAAEDLASLNLRTIQTIPLKQSFNFMGYLIAAIGLIIILALVIGRVLLMRWRKQHPAENQID